MRDTRSSLLLKLALLHARGDPSGPLLEAQAALLEPKLASLEDALGGASGFDAVVLRYRVASIRSVLEFVREA